VHTQQTALSLQVLHRLQINLIAERLVKIRLTHTHTHTHTVSSSVLLQRNCISALFPYQLASIQCCAVYSVSMSVCIRLYLSASLSFCSCVSKSRLSRACMATSSDSERRLFSVEFNSQRGIRLVRCSTSRRCQLMNLFTP